VRRCNIQGCHFAKNSQVWPFMKLFCQKKIVWTFGYFFGLFKCRRNFNKIGIFLDQATLAASLALEKLTSFLFGLKPQKAFGFPRRKNNFFTILFLQFNFPKF